MHSNESGDLRLFGALTVMYLVIAPVVLFVAGAKTEAGLVATTAWVMVCVYELGSVDQLRRWVAYRVSSDAGPDPAKDGGNS